MWIVHCRRVFLRIQHQSVTIMMPMDTQIAMEIVMILTILFILELKICAMRLTMTVTGKSMRTV